MLSLYEQNQKTFKWIKYVESIFNEVGLGFFFFKIRLNTSTRIWLSKF